MAAERAQIAGLVRSIYPGEDIAKIDHASMDVGVLSNVMQIDVHRESGVTALIAKFPRPEFPMMRPMFAVEAAFYTKTDQSRVPFRLATVLSASADAIVLAKLDNVKSYTCYDGCPAERVPAITRKLAQMHAVHWDLAFPELAEVPGIGANLSVDDKQTKFKSLFEPFLADLGLDKATQAAVEDMCKWLSIGKRLTRLHDTVESWHKSLIHGDFHVANMLFQGDSIFVLDWATCGASNPLRDLAFFFTVSVTADVRAAEEARSLRAYADILAAAVPDVSVAEVESMYFHCVLNQFVILVGYNALTMSLAGLGATPAKQAQLRDGFLETNRRSCMAAVHAFTKVKDELEEQQ
ncbi:hypothetical protein ACHHYP_03115 [Achlya hypogyna]|uniref:CHK kinase-like domain-containing protein n=1 Tax=Achlya hypogyna TaxID=1202772 RepID=A0A1V9Z4F3_ACHHY|nr:hypothetical protein ACHHYP_03115 [Achlya hypogyna]